MSEYEILERYIERTTQFFSEEIDGVRKEVKELNGEFKKMNGTLRDVCEWKAGMVAIEGEKSKVSSKTLSIVAVIIAGLMFAATLYFNARTDKISTSTKEEVKNIIDEYGFNMVTRGTGYLNDTIK